MLSAGRISFGPRATPSAPGKLGEGRAREAGEGPGSTSAAAASLDRGSATRKRGRCFRAVWSLVPPLLAAPPAGMAHLATASLAREYAVTVFDQEMGMWKFALASLAQTPDGWLWWSAFGSMGRFDGTRFEEFSAWSSPAFEQAWTRALFADRRGRLWAGCEGRILCHETNTWRVFAAAEGVGRGLFNNLTDDAQGALWAASANVILRETGTRFAAVPLPQGRQERGFRLATDRIGTVWCSSDLYLGRFEQGGWVQVLDEAQTQTNRVVGMAPARAGGFWAGCENDIKLWREGGWAKALLRPEGFRADPVALLEDSRGNLWAGGWRSGLLIYGADGQVRSITVREGLPNNSITDLLEDAEGNIWFSSNGGGLIRLRPLVFQTYGPEAGVAQVVNCVTEAAPGRMVLGTQGDGLLCWEAGQLSRHASWPETNGIAAAVIGTVLKDRHGDLWVGCYLDGLKRVFGVAGGVEHMEHISPAQTGAGTIKSLFEDRQGRLWIGTVAGLAVREEGQFRVCPPESGLPHMIVHAISQDRDGHIWVCGSGYGLFREQAGRFARFPVPGLDTNASFRALLAGRDGSLWVGTAQRALGRIQGTNCFVYGEVQGLPPFSIYGMLEDDSGYLWLGGSPGAARVRLTSLDRVRAGAQAQIEWQVFGRLEGFPGPLSYSFQPACWKASDGRLWFAAVRGLGVVDPSALPPPPPPPVVVIDQVQVNSEPPIQRRELGQPGKEMRLPPNTRQVAVQYSFVRLGQPGRVRFQQRLRREDPWQDVSASRPVLLRDLRPGNYEFGVRAADHDGPWGHAAAVAFVVRPYYWQTSWFWAGLLLPAAAIAWRAHGWRMAAVERRRQAQADFSRQLIDSQEADRKRMARELHDGLGQNLIVIKNRAQLGLQHLDPPAPLAAELRQISHAASQALEDMRATAHALHPYELDRFGLKQALEALTQRAAEASPTKFLTDLDSLDGLLKPSDQSHFFRIIQEGMSNILRHARATEVILEVKHQAGSVRATLLDDGCGFNPLAVGTPGQLGFGFQSMTERAHLIGGKLRIQSSPGRGTRLELTVPVTSSTQ